MCEQFDVSPHLKVKNCDRIIINRDEPETDFFTSVLYGTVIQHYDVVPYSFDQVETINLGPYPIRNQDSDISKKALIIFLIEDVTD